MIRSLSPSSVFEFGCNAGRNLELLRSQYGDEQVPRLEGIDINATSIAHGRELFPSLELSASDESYLDDNKTWSIVFTISVLDHLPHIEEPITRLARAAGHVLILLEPHSSAAGRVDAYKGVATAEWNDATPFSYCHDYDAALRDLPFSERINIPLPTGLARLGPLYRFRVSFSTTVNCVGPSIPIVGI